MTLPTDARIRIETLLAAELTRTASMATEGATLEAPENVAWRLTTRIGQIIAENPEPDAEPAEAAPEPAAVEPWFEATDFYGERIEISPYGDDHALVVVTPREGVNPVAVLLPRYEALKAAGMLARAATGKDVVILEPPAIEVHPDRPLNTGIGKFQITDSGIMHSYPCNACHRVNWSSPLDSSRVQEIGIALATLGRLALAEPSPSEVERLAETLIDAGAPSESAWNAARVVLRRFNLTAKPPVGAC